MIEIGITLNARLLWIIEIKINITIFFLAAGGGLNIWAGSYIKDVFCTETICQIIVICFQMILAVTQFCTFHVSGFLFYLFIPYYKEVSLEQ